MDRSAKQIVQRLGPTGLARVLDDVLDLSQLVRLANACGLEYPGMRTQSQTRERLLGDLADRGVKQASSREAILRVLRKETAAATKAWQALSPEERTARLEDETPLTAEGQLGLHLFLVASENGPGSLSGPLEPFVRRYLLRLAAPGDASPTEPTDADRELARLKRQLVARDKKARRLEQQLQKAREAQKLSKRGLIQSKGELAESRMLVERLRRDLAAAQTAAHVLSSPRSDPGPEKALADVDKAVRKLAAEHRKLTHAVEQSADTPRATAAAPKKELGALLASIETMQKSLTARAKADHDAVIRELAELRSAVQSVERRPKPATKKRIARTRGQAKRVGIFIDVQNVYYGARRLKGKLDFDALLEAAVRGRRLIKALAYVVESKEIDQSQFIKVLEHRAIEVQRKDLKVRADGSTKGDWDMELALDILDAAPRLDVVVLVSGDGDFTSLVKRVKNIGPRVEVIGFPRHTAKALVEAADAFQPLDRRFMIYPRRGKRDETPAKPTEADSAKAAS